MKKPFNLLTKIDVQWLRRQPAYGNCTYNFTNSQLNSARAHLQTLYPNCRVQTSFAVKILLLNELY